MRLFGFIKKRNLSRCTVTCHDARSHERKYFFVFYLV